MLAVTGIGMVSALGLDAVSSCAAARAGIRRIIQTDDLYVPDVDGEETAPVAVHRVPRISAGLFGFARLLQLGLAGLADLRRTSVTIGDPPFGMILLVDNGAYQNAWSHRLRQKADREGIVFEDDGALARVRARITKELLPALVKNSGIDATPRFSTTLSTTAIGIISALRQAEDWLARGACERCIVGGVDSLLDPTTLAALDGLALLKTPDRAVGIMPGEAACFVLLERPRKISADGSGPHAYLESPAQAEESGNHPLGAGAAGGGSLATSIRETLGRLSDGGLSTGTVVINLNGDPYRSSTWGRAIAAAMSPPQLGALPALHPPQFFGDIGTATGPVSIALLARGWTRQYLPQTNALICLMDDTGARGTIYVRAPSEVTA